MKAIKIFVVLFCCFFSKANSQSLIDSISFQDFKKMSFTQMKHVFKNDSPALKLIKTTQVFRVLKYAAIPIFFDPYLNLYALAGGISCAIVSTKKRLYQNIKAKYGNKDIPPAPFVPKYGTPKNIKIDSLPLFNISFHDFKKLSRKQQDSMFVYDYTTQYIFDYTYKHQIAKYTLSAITLGSFAGAAYCFALSDEITSKSKGGSGYNEASFLLDFFSLGLGVAGLVSRPFAMDALKRGSQRTLYNNFLQYYSNHIVSHKLTDYINNRRKNEY